MIKRILPIFALLIAPLLASAQEDDEDNNKMVREVVSVMVDKAKFAAPPPPPVEDHSKKKKKKHTEEVPPADPAAADTGNPMMPAPASEIAKRAQNWIKAKSPKYTKSGGGNSGSTITTTATFPFKQKLLNPDNDVDGTITMDVIIEAKEGKYRYTVKNIKHAATKPGLSGGDIYAAVPECGSMKMNDQTWKHVKSAAYADIQWVVDDLKARMKQDGDAKKKDDW